VLRSGEIWENVVILNANQKPTWLLFDADWMHTKQSVDYVQYLHKIVSVGRIKWFGNMTGKDNCAWYLFENRTTETKFYGRTNDS
jgi:hypothetical protein